MIIRAIISRLKMVTKYAGLSRRLRDRPALAILGLAKYRDFSNRDILSRLCRWLFPMLKVRPDRLHNLTAVLNPSDASHIQIFDEVVVENAYDLTLVGFVPELIVDCGGHIGLFTARAAATFPDSKLVVFEPMPKNVAVLTQMVRSNGLTIEVRPEAVSDREGSTKFFERMSYGGSLNSEEWQNEIVDSYDVIVVNLLKIIMEFNSSSLLLKMDIEGEEENLLPKLIEHVPFETAIFFETHTGSVGWDAIAAALRRGGFVTLLLRNRDPFRDGYASRCHHRPRTDT